MEEYFGVFFEDFSNWMEEFDIKFFADQNTAIGMAELFWAQGHDDKDGWYTVLTPLDLGKGLEDGGDFAFSELGHIFKVEDSDVFFFNPWYTHACTEPKPHARGSRIFISWYCKRATTNAAALSAAMQARVGNAPLDLCRLR